MGAEQSRSSIVSAALLHLGRDPVADLDSATDQTAGLFRSRYSSVRDTLLRSYPWNFAMEFASLPGSALAAPVFGYSHKCTLPAGGALPYCLRLWRLETAGIKYTVKGRSLYLAGTPPVSVAYVGRVENEEAFDPMFCELLALDLALALLNRVPSNDVRKRGNELKQDRARLRRTASLTDAMESSAGETSGGDLGSWSRSRQVL